MEQFDKPILFIVFNRLDTTQRVFDQIKKVKPLKLYIASDGPRDENEKIKVLKVREFILNSINWSCDVKTRFRDENLGVGFGPNDAISWFFLNEEEGIILEDDCLPSISFFSYCKYLLTLYKSNKKIGIIQGFNPFPNNYHSSYFFSKYDLKWGWATWKDRWQYQDMYTKDWPQTKKSDFLRNISNNTLVKKYWESIFDQIHRNPYLAWDTQFTYQMLKKGLLTVVPKNNIILNIGYRNDASSTRWGIPNHIKKLNLDEMQFPLKHPQALKMNNEYDNLVEKIHFEINIKTIARLKLRNFLESNPLFCNTILPLLVKIYRKYKDFKVRYYE